MKYKTVEELILNSEPIQKLIEESELKGERYGLWMERDGSVVPLRRKNPHVRLDYDQVKLKELLGFLYELHRLSDSDLKSEQEVYCREYIENLRRAHGGQERIKCLMSGIAGYPLHQIYEILYRDSHDCMRYSKDENHRAMLDVVLHDAKLKDLPKRLSSIERVLDDLATGKKVIEDC